MTTTNPNPITEQADRAAQQLKLATTYVNSLVEKVKARQERQRQLESDRRYFVKALLFGRLHDPHFHTRQPGKRKKELRRLERLYFLLDKVS